LALFFTNPTHSPLDQPENIGVSPGGSGGGPEGPTPPPGGSDPPFGGVDTDPTPLKGGRKVGYEFIGPFGTYLFDYGAS